MSDLFKYIYNNNVADTEEKYNLLCGGKYGKIIYEAKQHYDIGVIIIWYDNVETISMNFYDTEDLTSPFVSLIKKKNIKIMLIFNIVELLYPDDENKTCRLHPDHTQIPHSDILYNVEFKHHNITNNDKCNLTIRININNGENILSYSNY